MAEVDLLQQLDLLMKEKGMEEKEEEEEEDENEVEEL